MSELLGKGLILLVGIDAYETKVNEKILANDNCPDENITFYLYTKETQNNPVKVTEAEVDTIKFADTENLKILIHGVKGSRDDDFNKPMREAYFSTGVYNIITVDYQAFAASLKEYQTAIENLPFIAKCITQFLDVLLRKYHKSFKHVHAIGFSLGAQIAGFVGNRLNDDNKLYRITGIDPALPNFEFKWNHLKDDSATVVDILHTNCGSLGQLVAIGTVDFYANNCITQPGCENDEKNVYSKFKNSDLCSHWRAVEYFVESIKDGKNKGFYAIAVSPTHELPLFEGLFSGIPSVTRNPEVTDVPVVNNIPSVTRNPTNVSVATDVSVVTDVPVATKVPVVTKVSVTTKVPVVTENSVVADVPDVHDVPGKNIEFIQFGEYLDSHVKGIYIFKTDGKKPFTQGEGNLK